MSVRNDSNTRADAELGEEAAEWLLRFAEPGDEYPDEIARNDAFYEWIETSPEHLRVFLETVEVQQRLQLLDSHHRIKVDLLLRHRADVIPLHKEKPQSEVRRVTVPAREKPTPLWRRAFTAGPNLSRVRLRAIAATILVCALGT